MYAALAVIIMYLDQRSHYLESVRSVLQSAAYPIQLAVSSPTAAWRSLRESAETRDALRAENARLRAQQRELELRAMRYEALAHENGELRGLRTALPPLAERWLPAEIVNIQLSTLRQRLLINRGSTNGVFKGQAVLDDKGLIGQTVHVGWWSAEVILLTDPEHAIPVSIERTGLRTIAVGAGDATSLALPYLPANADIRTGDLLLSSGLGGVFPQGYPVARVTEVHRDAVQPLAQVRAAPLAHVDSDSEVVLVWFNAEHPAAPAATPDSAGDLRRGNATVQPQAAPPRPAAASAPQAAPPPPPVPPRPLAPPRRAAPARETEQAQAATQPEAPPPSAAEPSAQAAPSQESEQPEVAEQPQAVPPPPAEPPPQAASPSRAAPPQAAEPPQLGAPPPKPGVRP